MATTSTPTGVSTLTLRSPADLAAGVPYLLGFRPHDSIVVLALAERAVVCTARGDADPSAPEALARQLIDLVCQAHPTGVAILGYGQEPRVGPAVRAARGYAQRRGLTVTDALRVDNGRWWSYLCANPRCCPPDGTAYDDRASEVAAAFTLQGLVALADRSELTDQVTALDGPARESMTRATAHAWQRLSQRLSALTDDEAAAVVKTDGQTAVFAAIERYANDDRLDDAEVAWLTVLLQSIPVRDVAWLAIQHDQPHRRLWLDVTRRADPELVPAPASLLAFTAYRAGDGPLAGIALQRALTADPHYSMARLLGQALQRGLPPSVFDGWGAGDQTQPRS